MMSEEFENRVEELIGHRIARVRYHEILYTDEDGKPLPEPFWGWHPDFDSLDFGLDLLMEDGSVFHISWGAGFEQYGVTGLASPLHDESVVRVWNVTDGTR